MRAELEALELRRLSWRRVKGGIESVADDFTKFDLLTYSSAISFQVLYAVVPLVMLGLAGLGIFGAQSLYTNHIAHTLRHDLSPDAFGIVDRTARKAIGPERWFWASAGVIVTLWGVGASLRSMMTPLNQIYGARETRSWLRRLIVSIAGGAVVVFCVYGAIIVVLGGRQLNSFYFLLTLARWLLALALLLLSIATLLRAVPAKKRPVQWVSIGSALSAVCWIVATIGFGAYISAVSYSSYYGAFASLIILLIYLHVSAIAFLLGVTVDARLREAVRKRQARAKSRR